MTLNSSPLLRRIDTDFVNLSPIMKSLAISSPPSSIPNAIVISRGSTAVTGTWVPLATAQAFVRENPLPEGILDIFLSDTLFERFPPALQDFHRSKEAGRLLDQFGPHFNSTVAAVPIPVRAEREGGVVWDRDPHPDWAMEDLHALPPPFPIIHQPTPEEVAVVETPLSATEQEMFHALCSVPDWDKENAGDVLAPSEGAPEVAPRCEPAAKQAPAIPLRRSKRVANAHTNTPATQPRGRPRKRGSRALS